MAAVPVIFNEALNVSRASWRGFSRIGSCYVDASTDRTKDPNLRALP
jgi:hypothetical protein